MNGNLTELKFCLFAMMFVGTSLVTNVAQADLPPWVSPGDNILAQIFVLFVSMILLGIWLGVANGIGRAICKNSEGGAGCLTFVFFIAIPATSCWAGIGVNEWAGLAVLVGWIVVGGIAFFVTIDP